MFLSIHNESTRTLGEGGREEAYLQIGVGLRAHIKKFKGARLHVFLAIALHADKYGWSWPTVELLRQRTTYRPDTIYKALADLERLRINNRRLFLRTQVPPPHYRPKDAAGYARNFYLLCPSDDEVAHFEALRPATKRGVKKKENHVGKTGHGLSESEKPGAEKPGTDFPPIKQRQGSEAETGSEAQTHTPSKDGARRARRVSASGAKSKFGEPEVLEWATHEAKRPGSTIRDPKALASARHLDGAADDQIGQYFSNKSRPPAPTARRCDSSCPKCFGTGQEIVEGRGARRCPNSRPQPGALPPASAAHQPTAD
jgi:hypothetical protein